MKQTEIYLIRHAEPESGYSGRYDELPGPGLSQTGRYQARQVGLFLADKALRRIYHSPFQRTVETASAIVHEVGRPSQAADALREQRRGDSAAQVRARVVAFWENTVLAAPAPLALISHGGPIDQLLGFLSDDTLDFSEHRYWGGAGTPLAGVWRARWRQPETVLVGTWELELVYRPEAVTSA